MRGRNRWWKAGMLAGVAAGIPLLADWVLHRARSAASLARDEAAAVFTWPLGRIRYARLGDGQPILLLHGLSPGSSESEWRGVWEQLGDTFTIFAPDLPGFGNSDVPDTDVTVSVLALAVEDFLRNVVQRSAAVVTSGETAWVAARVAASAPELVGKLVLVCPPDARILRTPAVELRRRLTAAVLGVPILGELLYGASVTPGRIRRRFERHVYGDPLHVTPSVVERHYTQAHRSGARDVTRAVLASAPHGTLAGIVAEIAAPTLIVYGGQAEREQQDCWTALVQLRDGIQVRCLPRGKLLPHVEDSAGFVEAVTHFLRPPREEPVRRTGLSPGTSALPDC